MPAAGGGRCGVACGDVNRLRIYATSTGYPSCREQVRNHPPLTRQSRQLLERVLTQSTSKAVRVRSRERVGKSWLRPACYGCGIHMHRDL